MMKFALLFSSLVAVTYSYPWYVIQETFDEQTPCGEKSPTGIETRFPCQDSSTDSRLKRDIVSSPLAEMYDPYQKTIRNAFEAALPLIFGQDFMSDLSPSIQMATSNSDTMNLEKLDSFSSRNVRSVINSVSPLFGTEFQDSKKDNKGSDIQISEIMIPSPILSLFQSLPNAMQSISVPKEIAINNNSLLQEISSENTKFTESNENTISPNYGLYYVQLQSYNPIDDTDEIKSRKEEMEIKPQNKFPSKNRKSVTEQTDIIPGLQELLMGQIAILLKQQQMEKFSQRMYQQTEEHLREVLRHLLLMGDSEMSDDKVLVSETGRINNINSDFPSDDIKSTTPMTTSTAPTEFHNTAFTAESTIANSS